MKNFFFSLLFFWGAICLPSIVQAAPDLPAIFSNHMVIQREKPIKVWGTAQPGEKVTVNLAGQRATVRANKQGNWLLTLKAMPAGGPYTLTVKSSSGTKTIEDILIGEVWVCSGQSNMEWQLNGANDAAQEIDLANYNDIRSFNVVKEIAHLPKSDLKGEWEVCTPQAARNFSAVGYFFARNLYQQLNIPIGFINTSWGGTVIETWMSAQAFEGFPAYQERVKKLQSADFDERIKQNEEKKIKFQQAIENDPGTKEGWYATSWNKTGWKPYPVPQIWEGKELGALDGVVWFTYRFNLPQECVGRVGELSLGMIDDNDATWLNGKQVGATIGYNMDRNYAVPANLLTQENELCVRITDTASGGGIYGKPDKVYLRVNGTVYPLAGEWHYKVSVSNEEYKVEDFGPNSNPTLLFNAMINPLVNYAVKGAIWYQGESNADRAEEYRRLFPAMINDWRKHWNDDLSFYWVQLANFMEPDAVPTHSDWAALRDAQSATLSLPKTGQAVIIDIGEAHDIHPRNKQDVGKRLSLIALHKDYGFDLVYSGPVFRAVERSGNSLVVSFDSVGRGLTVHNKYGYLSGFAVAGADGKYYWAQAVLNGTDKVILKCDKVDAPLSVRYAWGNNPDDANLYNSEGLPASPFEASCK